jgi:hypothetical protein
LEADVGSEISFSVASSPSGWTFSDTWDHYGYNQHPNTSTLTIELPSGTQKIASFFKQTGGPQPPVPSMPAPDGLTASPVSSTEIHLDWNFDGKATDFRVERAVDVRSGPWNEIAVVPASYQAHDDSNLEGGTTYYYRVRAHQEAGNVFSPYSGIAYATTLPTVTQDILQVSLEKLQEGVEEVCSSYIPQCFLLFMSKTVAESIVKQFPVQINIRPQGDDIGTPVTRSLYVPPGKLSGDLLVSVNTYDYGCKSVPILPPTCDDRGVVYVILEVKAGGDWQLAKEIHITGIPHDSDLGFTLSGFEVEDGKAYRVRAYFGDASGHQYGLSDYEIGLTVVQKPPLQVFVPAEVSLSCGFGCSPGYVVLKIGGGTTQHPDQKISLPGSVSLDLTPGTYTIRADWTRGWFGEGETVLNIQISYPDTYLVVVHTVLRPSSKANGSWWWPFTLPLSMTCGYLGPFCCLQCFSRRALPICYTDMIARAV